MVILSRREFELAALAALCGSQTLSAQPPKAKEVAWLAEIGRPPAALPPGMPQLPPVLLDSQGKIITSLADWQKRRDELIDDWAQFLGYWEKPGRRQAPEFQILDSERVGSVVRRLITYQSERRVQVEAYLLTPRHAVKRPGVVVFHSTVDYTIRQGAGLEGPPEAAWGLRLAERGMVTLCPRCFLWDGGAAPGPNAFASRAAAHQKLHPQSLGMAKMLFDGRRAVDLLASLPEVDSQRIGAAGHSLGAKEALYLAAFDERIRAAVSSEGGIGVGFSNWDAPWYLGKKDFGHDHHELMAFIAPRPFLVIGGDSADGARTWPFVDAALGVYRLYGEPCRVGLLNHGQGHSIPPIAEARTYEWLMTYL